MRDLPKQVQTEPTLKTVLGELGDFKAALDKHAIVAVTDPKGKITCVNDKFCSISQYSREELLGQDHRIINSGHHPREFMRDLWSAITQGRVWHGEIKNRAKDGSYYWVDTTIVPFLDDRGLPRQYVSIRSEITKLKTAEEKIRQHNAELEQRVAERTAELYAANQESQAFNYSVSHDLRTPLRHVLGFVELLQKDAGPSLSGNRLLHLKAISDAASRMNTMIEDLLSFSRLGKAELQKRELDLNQLTHETIGDFQRDTIERKIEWKIHPLPVVWADKSLLRLVLVNLLANAVKFTGRRDHPRIEVGCASNGEDPTVIYVRDNGAGFDPRYTGKLFGVFHRLHSPDEFEGTGIGLANVQRIVQRHGGRAWAEGAVGKGATFYFSIPRTT
jgi:PAS domain S-box-containing protein